MSRSGTTVEAGQTPEAVWRESDFAGFPGRGPSLGQLAVASGPGSRHFGNVFQQGMYSSRTWRAAHHSLGEIKLLRVCFIIN